MIDNTKTCMYANTNKPKHENSFCLSTRQKCSITPEKGIVFTRAQEIGDKRRKSVMSDEGGKVEKEK